MSEEKNLPFFHCPVARSVDVIGDRWSLLIVRDVFDGICRFGTLQSSLGIARNILADRLRKLVNAGILHTRQATDGTAYQEYALTEEGETLFPVIVALRQWGEKHLFAPGERHSLLIETNSGAPIPFMQPRDSAGQVLMPAATKVVRITSE